MKKCSDCNVEMINSEISGQHPFEIGVDGESDLYVRLSKGKKEVKGLFGKTRVINDYIEYQVKSRTCPKCGKVELYIDLEK